MKKLTLGFTPALIAAGFAVTPALAAPTVDGTVDAVYGSPIAVQGVQTQFGDNSSEIDAAFATVENDTLYLTLTGNIENNFNKYFVFIDSIAGGQNSISATNNPQNFDSLIGAGFNNAWDAFTNRGLADSPLQAQAGNFTFDAGFEADRALLFRRGAGKFDFDFAIMDQTAIAADEFADAFGFVEEGSSGPITGSNSGFSFELGYDNSNIAGVGGGDQAADQAAAAAVTTGVELAIPFDALGLPAGSTDTIKITAFVNGSNADFVSNQFLGTLAAPQGSLGSDGNGTFLRADANLDGVLNDDDDLDGNLDTTDPELSADPLGSGLVDLNNYTGDQFFSVSLGGTVGITGDYNGSGQVEQGDLDLVLQNWGDDTGTTGIPAGWINDNDQLGQIEQTELDRVLQNWGSTSAPDFAGSAVPEPATLALLGLGGLAMLRRRA